MKQLSRLLAAFASVALAIAADVPKSDFYVSPKGDDSAAGTLIHPFATVARAQTAVREMMKTSPQRPLHVMLRAGTYYLPATLGFGSADSGDSQGIVWENYPEETPVLSGGIPVGRGGLGLTWKHVSGALWQVNLPESTPLFENLFYNGERRLRPRLQSASGVGYYMRQGSCYSTQTSKVVEKSLCNLGTFLRVAAEIPPAGAHAACPKVQRENSTDSKCLDRFTYNPADPIGNWANLNPSGSRCGGPSNRYPSGDVELNYLDAWTVNFMRVSCVDTVNHIVYFTAPMKGNSHSYNFHGPVAGHRFMVENVKDAFDQANQNGQTGLWFLDRSQSPWTLNYLANPQENPNRDLVVIPRLQPASPMGGSLLSAENLRHVTFRGVTFEVDNFCLPPSGFNNDENSDDTLPEAVDCESCQDVNFDAITVRRTSASAILIASLSGNTGEPAAHDSIRNSAFYDLGDCGIRIGHAPRGSDKPGNTVQFVTVENNIIQGYSRVFVDGEGISQGNGHDITYSHNDINDGYHAGMSICLLGCAGHEANGTNLISEYNHIWNTTQGVTADGGTLYYNVGAGRGSGTGDKILNNLVHDTTDSSIIDHGVHGSGYGGEGIYLDISSSGVEVENNVVYNMADIAAFMNSGPAPDHPPNTFHNNIFAYARNAMFSLATPWPSGCGSTLRVNVTNNIFYFDRDDRAGFYAIQGCPNSCGLDYNKFLNFQGNLYWRADGGFAGYEKAFHTMKDPHAGPAKYASTIRPANTTFLTFAQWQDGRPPNGIPGAMNEDAGGTVSVDPGFGHSGKPADFLLKKNPVEGFDYTRTNDTIRNAGRNHPLITPPKVPHTFPTYSFTEF